MKTSVIISIAVIIISLAAMNKANADYDWESAAQSLSNNSNALLQSQLDQLKRMQENRYQAPRNSYYQNESLNNQRKIIQNQRQLIDSDRYNRYNRY